MHTQFSLLTINFINCLRVVNVPRFMLVQMIILRRKVLIKAKIFLDVLPEKQVRTLRLECYSKYRDEATT